MSELRRGQQQYNSYIAALGAETVARSGLVRQLRNLLTQQASPPPGSHVILLPLILHLTMFGVVS